MSLGSLAPPGFYRNKKHYPRRIIPLLRPTDGGRGVRPPHSSFLGKGVDPPIPRPTALILCGSCLMNSCRRREGLRRPLRPSLPLTSGLKGGPTAPCSSYIRFFLVPQVPQMLLHVWHISGGGYPECWLIRGSLVFCRACLGPGGSQGFFSASLFHPSFPIVLHTLTQAQLFWGGGVRTPRPHLAAIRPQPGRPRCRF